MTESTEEKLARLEIQAAHHAVQYSSVVEEKQRLLGKVAELLLEREQLLKRIEVLQGVRVQEFFSNTDVQELPLHTPVALRSFLTGADGLSELMHCVRVPMRVFPRFILDGRALLPAIQAEWERLPRSQQGKKAHEALLLEVNRRIEAEFSELMARAIRQHLAPLFQAVQL